METNPFFSSLVKNVGFALARVRLDVWELYLPAEDLTLVRLVRDEFDNAVRFVEEVSGHESLLWHRPWIGETLHLRAPTVNALNLLQLVAMEKREEPLFRETVMGIASGMLITG